MMLRKKAAMDMDKASINKLLEYIRNIIFAFDRNPGFDYNINLVGTTKPWILNKIFTIEG